MSLPNCDTCGHREVDHAEAGGPCIEEPCECRVYAIDIQKHVAGERERCAKIAEAYLTYDYNMADVIAKEIREG